jgi:small-conductance mechanosensitive channel
MNELQTLQWVLPIFFILAGYATGKIFEHLIVGRLNRFAGQTKWRGDDILVNAAGKTLTLWFLLAGFYGALETIPLSADISGLLKKILLIAFVASGTLVIARLAVSYVNLYATQVRGVLPSTTIFSNLTRALVYIIGLLVILQSLGISITPILTALGVGGLAVALALQDTLSNLFAGLQVIGSGQLRPGDFIRLESGEEGYVVDVTWWNTTIRQLANNMVIVPNAHLASSRVINFDQPEKEQAVLVQVGVSYDTDLQRVEHVTIEVARDVMKSVRGGISGFEPFIRYHTFGDFSVNYTVILRGETFVDQYLIKHEFIKRLHRRFQREGIEIPFPIRTVHLKSGTATTALPHLDSTVRSHGAGDQRTSA